jgi:hypothetical protein
MKQISFFAAVLMLAIVSRVSAAELSVDFFYDSLAPQGDWVEVGDYGYCWHPRDVSEDWRPYTDGHWVFTDAGWTWVSDESWGWATYHYGRWARVEDEGWVWVPDTEWAPAWVSWRHSDRYVGWAPLPPEARFEARVGIKSWADSYYDIGPSYYSFVETRNIGSPSLRRVIVEPRENLTIINSTTNITNISYTQNNIYNAGPDYAAISRVSEQPVQKLKLERRTDIDASGMQGQQLTARVQGQSLQVVAPRLTASTTAVAPKKVVRRVDAAKIDRGWQKAGDPAAVEQARAKMKSEAKIPADLPPQPKFEKRTTGAGATVSPAASTGEAAATPSSSATPETKATSAMTPSAQTTPAPARKVASPGASATAPGATAMPSAGPKMKGKNRMQPSVAPAASPAEGQPSPMPREKKHGKMMPSPAPAESPAKSVRQAPEPSEMPSARPRHEGRAPESTPDMNTGAEAPTPHKQKKTPTGEGEVKAPSVDRSQNPPIRPEVPRPENAVREKGNAGGAGQRNPQVQQPPSGQVTPGEKHNGEGKGKKHHDNEGAASPSPNQP